MTRSLPDTPPPGYTPAEWLEYRQDPARFCARELDSADKSVRFNAADILRGLGVDAASALPSLIRTAGSDPDDSVRTHALFALADLAYSLRGDAADAIPLLLESVEDPDAERRSLAAVALGNMRISSTPVISALRALAEDPVPDVQQAARDALRDLDDA